MPGHTLPPVSSATYSDLYIIVPDPQHLKVIIFLPDAGADIFLL